MENLTNQELKRVHRHYRGIRRSKAEKYRIAAWLIAITPTIVTMLVVQIVLATMLVMVTTAVVILAFGVYKRGEEIEK